MTLNWAALKAYLDKRTINPMAKDMARNLVRMTNKNSRFVGTASPTASDARVLVHENIITIDTKNNNKVHFTKKALDLLNK